MNKNSSTPAQRSYIESLAKKFTMMDLETILKPAFAINSNSFNNSQNLNQNLKRLNKTAASRCIEILKGV